MLRRIRGTPVSGYILKDEAPENLAQALRVIQQGAVWFSQSVAQKMLGMVTEPDPLQALTSRERQILERIVQGLDNQAIANDLNLAEQTVRNYASTLYEKLAVSSRTEAVVWARENNIVC